MLSHSLSHGELLARSGGRVGRLDFLLTPIASSAPSSILILIAAGIWGKGPIICDIYNEVGEVDTNNKKPTIVQGGSVRLATRLR